MKSKPTRYYSSRQEKEVARALKGKTTPNSGARWHTFGDVLTKNMLIECKTSTTDKKSYSIKKSIIEKTKHEAFSMSKRYFSVAFNFGPDSENYYIITEELMKILLEQITENNS